MRTRTKARGLGLVLVCLCCTPSFAAAPTVTVVAPNSGTDLGGQTVTITGTNFNSPAVTAVTFGGSPALSFVVINDNVLSAVSPPHALGVVSVEVTNASGSNPANALYSFSAGNPGVQILAKVTLKARADVQWGNGTSVDDAGVDHTQPAQRITAYTWVVIDPTTGTNLDVARAYLSNDVTNNKTINVENVSQSNSTLTIDAIASDTTAWSIGAAAGNNVFRLRASMNGGPSVTLSGAPAMVTNTLLKNSSQVLVLEFTTPTQISPLSAAVQQSSMVTLVASAN